MHIIEQYKSEILKKSKSVSQSGCYLFPLVNFLVHGNSTFTFLTVLLYAYYTIFIKLLKKQYKRRMTSYGAMNTKH